VTNIVDKIELQEVVEGSDFESIIELFDVTIVGTSNTLYFANMLDVEAISSATSANQDNIVWNNNEYVAIPIQLEGIAMDSSGPAARPTLTIANIPVLSKQISALARDGTTNEFIDTHVDEDTLYEVLRDFSLERNDQLIGTKVIYRRTLSSHLGTSEEFPSSTYFIDRVEKETAEIVTFELASPFDIEGASIPARNVIGRYCPWEYQGYHLTGNGGCTWPLNSKNLFFDYDDNQIDISVTNLKDSDTGDSLDDKWQEYTAVASSEFYISGGAGWTYSGNPVDLTLFTTDNGTNATAHGLSTKDPIIYLGSDDFDGNLSWLTPYITYFVKKESDTTFRLATSLENLKSNTFVALQSSDTGDGTHEFIKLTEKSYSVGDIVYTKETSGVYSGRVQIWKAIRASTAKDPRENSFYWTRHDVCGKFLNSCKKRFQDKGGSVSSVTITNGGSGYSNPPTVTFSEPVRNKGGILGVVSSIRAEGTANLSGGVVTSVTITKAGKGYRSGTATVTFSDPESGTDTATGTVVTEELFDQSKSIPFGGFPGVRTFK